MKDIATVMETSKPYIYVPNTQKIIWVSKRRASHVAVSLDEFLGLLVKKGLTVNESAQYFKENVQSL